MPKWCVDNLGIGEWKAQATEVSVQAGNKFGPIMLIAEVMKRVFLNVLADSVPTADIPMMLGSYAPEVRHNNIFQSSLCVNCHQHLVAV